jgi:glycosyl hydrolase family 26
MLAVRGRFLAVGSLIAVAVVAARADAVLPTNVQIPSNGAYLGAYVAYGPQWIGEAHALSMVSQFESQIGRRLAIVNRFYGWTASFPTQLEADDVALGRIPMVTWKAPSLDTILDGSQDALIVARASAVRRFGSPVFIRWAWEMNGGWTEWSGQRNETPGTHDGAAKYIRAWHRVHDLFARQGATNVSWIWAPNGTSVPTSSWNAAAAYYPGDAYVDWIGVSVYNWGKSRAWSHWTSFEQLVAPFYRRWALRKPLIVAETASVGSAAAKAHWIAGIGPALKERFPQLKAVVWFQSPPDWTATDPGLPERAMRALAAASVVSAKP